MPGNTAIFFYKSLYVALLRLNCLPLPPKCHYAQSAPPLLNKSQEILGPEVFVNHLDQKEAIENLLLIGTATTVNSCLL